MAHVTNKALYILNADSSPGFDPGVNGGVAYVTGTEIFYFHDTGTTWTKVDIGAISSADGNHTPITRGNATENVAPSGAEVSSPVSGDSASVYLTSGKLEYWVYTSSWTKAYVLQADLASNLSNGTRTTTAYTINNSNGTGITLAAATTSLAGLLVAADKQKLDYITITQAVNLDTVESQATALVTLSGVASGSVNLGTFTGNTIPNTTTIKAALQALETALESMQIDVVANTHKRTTYADYVSITNVTLTGEKTIDGNLTSTSRVLLVNQTDSSENGIYVTAAGAWSRATDMNQVADFTIGRLILVKSGTAKADTLWANQGTVTTLETDAISIQCIKSCVSSTQDNEIEIVPNSDGLRITKQPLTAYASHSIAAGAVSIGDSYLLTANNIEGSISDGVSGPVYRRMS